LKRIQTLKKHLIDLPKSKLEPGKPNLGLRGLLASQSSKRYAKALKKSSTIDRVPLDRRDIAKKVFDEHINKLQKPSTVPGRTPLLCTIGIRGSGKTVQQAFNMKWFLDRFPNGIAIEISFNDDCYSLRLKSPPIDSDTRFEIAVVKGIILRLVEYCYGINFSSGGSSAEMNEYLKSDYSRWFADFTRSPIASALEFVRQVLGLPDDAPILLCIDELVKLGDSRHDLDPTPDAKVVQFSSCW